MILRSNSDVKTLNMDRQSVVYSVKYMCGDEVNIYEEQGQARFMRSSQSYDSCFSASGIQLHFCSIA